MSGIPFLNVMMLGFLTKPMLFGEKEKQRFKSLDIALCVKIILILPESNLEFKKCCKNQLSVENISIILNLPN